jgi:predicted RNase H-like HicB family nuclease
MPFDKLPPEYRLALFSQNVEQAIEFGFIDILGENNPLKQKGSKNCSFHNT